VGESGVSSPFRDDLLAGRVALVTGGGTGLGAAIASAMAALGAAVGLVSRSEEHVAGHARTLRERGHGAAAATCDVRRPEEVAAAVGAIADALGPVDILVNNAAGNFRAPAERLSPNGFRAVVEIDLLGTFHVTREVIGSMVERGGGCILSVTIADPARGFPGFSHAGAAKAGIAALTATWAREWGPHGVRVNAIGPGPIPTEGVARHMLGRDGDWREVYAPIERGTPLARLGTAADVASAALFLCSPAAAFITGLNLPVDHYAAAA
jgi:NAD(P)-dependent dehydrogenase (short-subunit alcohol dehydrogenase family)